MLHTFFFRKCIIISDTYYCFVAKKGTLLCMNVANTAQNIDVSSQILDALAQILGISTYKLKAIARFLDASSQL